METLSRQERTEITNKLHTGGNPFYSKTDRLPRPTLHTVDADGRVLFVASNIQRAQAAWDEAKVKDDELRAWSAGVQAAKDAEAKRIAEQKAQKAEARRLDAREKLLGPARSAFMQSGGTAEEWESQELKIEADIRSRLAADAAVSATAGTLSPDQWRRQSARDF